MTDGTMVSGIISETEAYKGSEDLACHASRGKTPRNKVMFEEGGLVYMYLIYGIYWMMNFVTGREGDPQAVLIRGLKEVYGPGRLTKQLQIDASFYGEDLSVSNRLWIEAGMEKPEINAAPRIGIDYAGDYWKNVPWRFFLKD
jgi:DNA-3-methyladenine glycosylase